MRISPSSTASAWCLAGAFFLAQTALADPGAEILGLAGKCLDVLGSSTAEGTDVILFRCHGTANQRWDLPARGFTGEIRGLEGKCLDVRGGVAQDRARAELRSCDGRPTQQWRFGQDGRIVGDGGLCLDVLGSNTADLTPIVVFGCHGKSNQSWRPRTEGRFTLTNLEADAFVDGLWTDPRDPRVLYANPAHAGLFRSEDGGESWSPLFDVLPAYLDGLTLESQNRAPRKVLYAAESFGDRYRSLDDGASWQKLETDFSPAVLVLAADGRSRLDAYAVTADGAVYLSRDAGSSWQPRGTLPSQMLTDAYLSAQPGRSGVLIASVFVPCGRHCREPGGVFRSTNGGKSWKTVLADVAFTELWFDAAAPARAVARDRNGKLFRSQNGGVSWLEITPPEAAPVLSWVVDSVQSTRLLATSHTAFYLSEDFGGSWTSRPMPELLGSATSVSLLASAADGTLWGNVSVNLDAEASSREGLYRSTDFGQTWSRSGRGLINADISGVVAVQGRREVYAYGVSGVLTSGDGGTRWRQLRERRHDALAVDPFNTQNLIAASFYPPELVRSTDRGATFTQDTQGLEVAQIFGLAYDPTTEGRVFATVWEGGDDWFYVSHDGGASWGRARQTHYSPDLSVAPDGRLYLTSSKGIDVSSDGGSSWQTVLTEAGFQRFVAADETRPGRVWAATFDLWLSDDGGQNWRQVPLPMRPDVGFPLIKDVVAAEGTVYLRTSETVWRSRDEGASWSELETGLPAETFGSLTIDANRKTRLWLTASWLGVFVGDFGG